MPHIRVRGIEDSVLQKSSKTIIDGLSELTSTPKDYFVVEKINSKFYFDGEPYDMYPHVEVLWFDRGNEIQDKAAAIITDTFASYDIQDIEVAFMLYEKRNYYMDGKHL